MGCKKCDYGYIYTCGNCGARAFYDYDFRDAFCDTCEILKEKYTVDSNDCPNCNESKDDETKNNSRYKELITEPVSEELLELLLEEPLTESKDIFGTPIKISNLEVAQHDFPNSMNWDDAKVACAKIGEGWKLPTKDELNLLYQNKDKIGDFADYDYWSSTENSTNYAWLQSFYDGSQIDYGKSSPNNVRAVRAF